MAIYHCSNCELDEKTGFTIVVNVERTQKGSYLKASPAIARQTTDRYCGKGALAAAGG